MSPSTQKISTATLKLDARCCFSLLHCNINYGATRLSMTKLSPRHTFSDPSGIKTMGFVVQMGWLCTIQILEKAGRNMNH